MQIVSKSNPTIRQMVINSLVQGVIISEPGKEPRFEGKWIAKPIPLSLWSQVVSFFRKYPSDEVQVRLYYDTTPDATQPWAAWAHPQRGQGMTTKEDSSLPETGTPPNVTNHALVNLGTIHSHCRASAFQSSTDEANERNQDGPHITIGLVDAPKLSLHWRVYFNEFRFDISETELFETVTVTLPVIPEEFKTQAVIDAVAKAAVSAAIAPYFSPPPAEYPAAWDTNVAKGYSGNGSAHLVSSGMGGQGYHVNGNRAYVNSYRNLGSDIIACLKGGGLDHLETVIRHSMKQDRTILCSALTRLISKASKSQMMDEAESAQVVAEILEFIKPEGPEILATWREETAPKTPPPTTQVSAAETHAIQSMTNPEITDKSLAPHIRGSLIMSVVPQQFMTNSLHAERLQVTSFPMWAGEFVDSLDDLLMTIVESGEANGSLFSGDEYTNFAAVMWTWMNRYGNDNPIPHETKRKLISSLFPLASEFDRMRRVDEAEKLAPRFEAAGFQPEYSCEIIELLASLSVHTHASFGITRLYLLAGRICDDLNEFKNEMIQRSLEIEALSNGSLVRLRDETNEAHLSLDTDGNPIVTTGQPIYSED